MHGDWSYSFQVRVLLRQEVHAEKALLDLIRIFVIPLHRALYFLMNRIGLRAITADANVIFVAFSIVLWIF